MVDSQLNCEHALRRAIGTHSCEPCPPLLAQALDYAVFPGGARVRPRLCLAVALANGNPYPELTSNAAVALELLHCASLVHDDLPCFDDATSRRGKPSVHAAFGERIAVLTGDTLIIAAFHQLGYHRARSIPSDALAKVLTIIASGTGAPAGICAGQAWECEPAVNLAQYHQAKTGALFVASTCAGAAAADVDPQPWRALGAAIGQAYQVADDIQDCLGSADTLGKPAGRDATLGRPNAVHSLGVDGAVALLNRLLNDGIGSIPDCQGKGFLQALVEKQAERFFPPGYHREAA